MNSFCLDMQRMLRAAAAAALCAAASGLSAAPWEAHVAALEAAAARGDPGAQTELAMRYEHAEGVPRDYRKAKKLYCQAAKGGYAAAQFNLGWMLLNGRGVPRDEGAAAALFRIAADQGNEHAAKLLTYVRGQHDAQLPSCMLPDPPVALVPENSGATGPDRSEIKQLVRRLMSEDSAVTRTRRDRSEIEQIVLWLAPQYAVDPKLVLAVISVESAFKPEAVSPKNAQGLMQLIPETAERFGVRRVFNPVENIKGGLAYLRWLLAFFQGDVPLVLAAYNAGERAVERYRGIPPYAETRNYVKRITSIYKQTIHPYEAAVVEPSPIMSQMRRTRGRE